VKKREKKTRGSDQKKPQEKGRRVNSAEKNRVVKIVLTVVSRDP
jgi:hypothetical protein